MNVREYNRVVDQQANALFRFAFSLMKDREEAQDLVQDAFTKLWEKRDNVASEKAKSYLFTSVHHSAVDQFRKTKRMREHEPELNISTTTHQTTPDLQAVLHEALNTLPEIQKSVVLMRDYEGYSYEEIAEMTELTLSQVKVYIFRARKKLKSYIGSMEAVI